VRLRGTKEPAMFARMVTRCVPVPTADRPATASSGER
jgi:hypothetical protein